MNFNEFVETIESELDETYELVFVDRGDELDDEAVNLFLEGREEEYYEQVWEWEADQQHYNAYDELKDLSKTIANRDADNEEQAAELLDELKNSPDWDELIYEIRGRDSSKWVRDIINNTSAPLMRVEVEYSGETVYYSDEDTEDSELLEKIRAILKAQGVDLKVNEEAIETIDTEAGAGWRKGYWVFTPDDLSAILLAPEDAVFEVTNPALWMTNPYSGDGFAEQIEGTVLIKRSELHTDKYAGGYSADDVFGLIGGAWSAEVKVKEAE